MIKVQVERRRAAIGPTVTIWNFGGERDSAMMIVIRGNIADVIFQQTCAQPG